MPGRERPLIVIMSSAVVAVLVLVIVIGGASNIGRCEVIGTEETEEHRWPRRETVEEL